MGTKRHWTRQEAGILREHYPFISARSLVRALPGRSEKSIKDKALEAGLRKCPERVKEASRENVMRRYSLPPDGAA